MCCSADPHSMLLMGRNAIDLVCVCFVFCRQAQDAIPMCGERVVLYWEHGKGADSVNILGDVSI